VLTREQRKQIGYLAERMSVTYGRMGGKELYRLLAYDVPLLLNDLDEALAVVRQLSKEDEVHDHTAEPA